MKWVSGFNAIPRNMIEALWTHAGEYEGDGWQEVTPPCVGDEVYYHPTGKSGELVEIFQEYAQRKYDSYMVEIEDELIECGLEDIRIERYTTFPMHPTMWSFGESLDESWLDNEDCLQAMSECGFRIYEHEEFGYVFAIDGGEYDYYERHWIPLYTARGLQWHEEEVDKKTSLIETLKAGAEKSKAAFGEKATPQEPTEREV